MSSCVDQIFLFQKKLNKYAKLNEADKVLYYLHKLNHLSVTVSHLEETGVGKTVNALRHQGGKVGEKARGLVNKWKAMVTAEEEEEEEEGESEEVQPHQDAPVLARDERDSQDYDEENEDEEEDEEENCLQIEENNNPTNDNYDDPGSDLDTGAGPAPSLPHPAYSYGQTATSGSEGEEEDGYYNPLTSRRDYQAHIDMPVPEYHPSAMPQSPRDSRDGSREGSSPEYGGASPAQSRNWKNGTSARTVTKTTDKDHRERDKHRSKGKAKHRDSSSSQERERKKDKHRDKHRDKETRDVEEEKRAKTHKDKHRDREKHHGRPRESKHKGEDGSVLNGFNTPEHKERSSKRESRESERSVEERHRERVEEGHYQREESAPQTKHADRTKPDKDKHRESSGSSSSNRKSKHKRDHREKEEASPDRQKKEKRSKQPTLGDEESCSNSVNKGSSSSSSLGERNDKEGKGKHKENRHKHKESSKKDKHKRDAMTKHEEQEQESPSLKNKEKKNKQKPVMDSGFGAVLMGLDSQVKKKKKKKKKEADKERDSGSEDEQPSTSTSYKRGPSSTATLPDSKKPKLLTAAVDKLPRLPTMVVADEKPLLPEITPNYKPLPRLPVREDAPESVLSKMTEEEALNFVFQSKYNRRSKVYSGKVCGLSYVPSLYESCIRVLQENIDALEYTGGIPFEILRPVLERASAKQLLNLEDFNHYLLDDSDVLWEVHCKRDFKKMKPEEMESWREMWIRCSEERDRRLKNLTHNLTEKFLTKAEPKRTTKIAYVDTAAKVPRNVARAQAKYGTATASALAAKPGKGNELAARKTAMQNVQRAERAANPRPVAARKKKVAPLMAKTKQFFKKAFRR